MSHCCRVVLPTCHRICRIPWGTLCTWIWLFKTLPTPLQPRRSGLGRWSEVHLHPTHLRGGVLKPLYCVFWGPPQHVGGESFTPPNLKGVGWQCNLDGLCLCNGFLLGSPELATMGSSPSQQIKIHCEEILVLFYSCSTWHAIKQRNRWGREV